MKTRSKKLHCDNLQKRNDFSKSASLYVPQLSSQVCVSADPSLSELGTQEPFAELFGTGHEKGMRIAWILFAREEFHIQTRAMRFS